MNLVRSIALPLEEGIPRVSGGEPVIPLDSDKLVVYSPRERG